jgi:tRNA(fMet)-specific endonuclease VapC
MSGKPRYILDTNAVVSLLNGNHELAARLETAGYVGISVVTYLEFLAFDSLTDKDRKVFERFASRVDIVPLSHDDKKLMTLTLNLRSIHRIKLPDAIIGATAISREALLITNDGHFSGIPTLIIQGC